jgi:multidrug resistance efflux pump
VSAQAKNLPPALGFPQPANGLRAAPVVRPTPLPKRPKGRWFVGVILVAICAYATYQVWGAYFRYRAYGTVSGRVIELSPPWEGVVRSIHVQEGERVRQGQLLVSVDNLELSQRFERLGDELKIAQANLEAEVAKLKWQVAFNIDHGQGALATYYETAGKLLQEQAKLDELSSMLPRAKILAAHKAVPQQELDQIVFQQQGLEQKIAKLKESLLELKKRADLARVLLEKGAGLSQGQSDDGYEQLKPSLAHIEALHADRARIQKRLAQSQLCAPANGLVVKIHHFAGENCKASEPLLSVLEDGSLQVVLYLPQQGSTSFAVGEEINVLVEPHAQLLICAVARLGDRYEAAPENIKRHFHADQKLLPIYLQPKDEPARWVALRIGGVVKLPYDWPGFAPGSSEMAQRASFSR